MERTTARRSFAGSKDSCTCSAALKFGHMARKYFAGDGDPEHDYESFFHRTSRVDLHGGRRTTSTAGIMKP